MHHSKKTQRGATLAGYAIILSAFTAMSLGAMEGLNSASETYLEETSDDIAQSRELTDYDELEEITEPEGDGGDTDEEEEGEPTFELADGGQFQNPTSGECITLQSDGFFEMAPCDGSPEQQISVYTLEGSSSAQLRIGDDCIGLKNNSANNADQYQVQDCDEDNANQLFRRNAADKTWESANNRSPVMCLDASHSGKLHQWGCHGEDNQEWADPAPYEPPFAGPPTPTVTGEGTFVGEIPGGTDFRPNQAPFEDDDQVFVFTESAILFDTDTDLLGTTVPAGTTVCSYIVWYDPVSNNDVATTIDFGAPILTGAQSTWQLQNTNNFAAPGVDYQNYNRPWESDDEFVVSGNTLSITPYAVANNADMLRVFTACG